MCDQCQYRTVNKQNYDNHLEDHKNGLVAQGQEGDEDNQQSGSASRRRLTAVTKQGTKAKPPQASYPVGNVSSVDLSKVAGLEGFVPGELNAAQLIYSALNAMSQQQQQTQSSSQAVPSDASVQQASSVTSTTRDGVTTHTITLHLPHVAGGAPAEVVPASQGGTSSAAAVDITNTPVVLTVNPNNQQTISQFGGGPSAEPSAAAGEIHLNIDTSRQQQQVTGIFLLFLTISSVLGRARAQQANTCKIVQSSLHRRTMYTSENQIRYCHLLLNSPATSRYLEFYFFLNSAILHSCILSNSCSYLLKSPFNT